ARLADDGMLFSITNVAYADRSQVDAEVEEFTAPCNAPPPANPPYFPVIKVSVSACWAGSRSATVCSSCARRCPERGRSSSTRPS
ncbi:MAG: hypothetical protein ACKO2K_07060, partial [Alphaproteobacteria bacterium]